VGVRVICRVQTLLRLPAYALTLPSTTLRKRVGEGQISHSAKIFAWRDDVLK
jgi:hypothetical protein